MNTILIIALALILLWLLGFGFSIGGAFIHLLFVVAVILLIYRLWAGRRRAL